MNKSVARTVSREEIGIFLDEVKTYILGSLSEQIDTLKLENKKRAESDALSIFSPKCRYKHALRKFPLDFKVIETCVLCTENHETKKCPSIPGLKVVYQEEIVPNQVDPLFFVARRP